MLIAISDIAVVNRQRKDLDLKEVSELAASIEANGLLHPIVVRAPHSLSEGSGLPYVLVVGGRRLAAHVLLGRDGIEASLKENLNPLSAEVCELEENLKRVNLSWQEEVAAKARIHSLQLVQNPMQTLSQTAEYIGESKANLSKDIALAEKLRIDPSLRASTSKGAAHRSADFKQNIATKVANVARSSADDIRSRLYIGDALDFAATIPSASIDLVFTDLPYGIDNFETQSTGKDHAGRSAFDDSKETVLPFLERLVPEACRVIKPTGWIVFFMCYEYHAQIMDWALRSGCTPEMPPWIWHRPGSSNWGHFPELHAANRYEVLVVANGGRAKFVKKPLENVLTYAAVPNVEKLHNHQKPHEMCRDVIERFTVAGETVLDFCFGSGALLAAAADLGRNWRGSEKNPAMLDPAVSLISQYHKVRV